MDIVPVLLHIGAAVAFVLATFNTPVRINLIGLGLLLWVCVPIFNAVT